MTQSLHTSFLEPDLVDQTFSFIIEPVSMVLDPLDVPSVSHPSMQFGAVPIGDGGFSSSLDHAAPDAP